MRTVGPNVMASVYRSSCVRSGSATARSWRRRRPSHDTYLHPGEAELIDASLIRATCLVGTAEALVEQVRELEREGLQELMSPSGWMRSGGWRRRLRGG